MHERFRSLPTLRTLILVGTTLGVFDTLASVCADDDRDDDRTGRPHPTKTLAPRRASAPQSHAYQLTPETGPVGTSVTVRGPGITHKTQVRVGPRRAVITATARGVATFSIPAMGVGNQPITIVHGRTTTHVGVFLIEMTPAVSSDSENAETGSQPKRDHDHGSSPPPVGATDLHDHATAAQRRHERQYRSGRWPWRGDQLVVASLNPRQGPIGTVITVRGERFPDDIRIALGSPPVLIEPDIAAEKIFFEVPERARGGPVRVQSATQQIDRIAGFFEISDRDENAERAIRRNAWRKNAENRWRTRAQEWSHQHEERLDQRRQHEQELVRTREERRRIARAAILASYPSEFVAALDTQIELSLHGERRALLGRMLLLAESLNKGKLVVRIGVAIQSEDFRHQQRMMDLQREFATLSP